MSAGANACKSSESSIGMRSSSSSAMVVWPQRSRSEARPGHHMGLPVIEAQEILPREPALSERGGSLEKRHVDDTHALGARRLGDLLRHHLPHERDGDATQAMQDLVGAANARSREHRALGDAALVRLVLARLRNQLLQSERNVKIGRASW